MDANFFSGPEMQALRHSLYYQVDENTNFREKVLNLIDAESFNPQDAYFYDMIPAIRFLYNDKKHVAYTTPNKRIWLNVPHEYNKVDWWVFIYYHECLHQLWDTFGVEDEIRKSGVKCYPKLLNLASDCVINDFLANIRKKKEPPNLINPEWVEKEFGVKYDRYVDNQLSLYMKMLQSPKMKDQEEIEKMIKKMLDGMGDANSDEDGEGENQSGQGDDEGQNGGGSNGNNPADSEGGEEGEGGGKGGENTAGGKGKSGKGSHGNEGKRGEGGQGSGEAAEISDTDAPNAGAQGGGKMDKSKKTTDGFSYDPKYDDLADKYIQDISNQYRNSLSGQVGDFVSKCKGSVKDISKLKDMGKEGITAHVHEGGSRNWNKKFNMTVERFIAQRFNKASQQTKKTYMKPPRRGGITQIGAPVMQGKMRIRDGIVISMAFYVDTSGSMSGAPIANVCKAVNKIAQDVEGKYKRKLAGKQGSGFNFEAWSFDVCFHKEKMPLGIPARQADNIDLDELLIGMQEKTKTSWINVIFTDAGFPVDPSVCVPIIKKFEGVIIYVINGNKYESEYNEIANKCKNFIYIQADNDFTV